jgi:hypothetical protein
MMLADELDGCPCDKAPTYVASDGTVRLTQHYLLDFCSGGPIATPDIGSTQTR